MAEIGKRNVLSIVREAPPGLYLNGGELGEILLPRRYIPPGLKAGDKLNVFVYLDSEDRLVATTESPLATVGEFAALEVVGIHERAGAFLNWGLAKDLLLPFREQEHPVRVGQKVVVAVYLDQATRRIAASTRLSRYLSADTPAYAIGQAVNLLLVRPTPLGFQAIVANSHLGLLFRDNDSTQLEVGQRTKGYVRAIRPNGKIDLGLDASGYKRVMPLQLQIIKALEQNGGRLELDDSSAPEVIRAAFGTSKGAFKDALGGLYKARRIRFTNPGIEMLDNSEWRPASQKE